MNFRYSVGAALALMVTFAGIRNTWSLDSDHDLRGVVAKGEGAEQIQLSAAMANPELRVRMATGLSAAAELKRLEQRSNDGMPSPETMSEARDYVESHYGGFFRCAGLSPEERAAVESILVDKELISQDLLETARRNSLDAVGTAIVRSNALADLGEKLRACLDTQASKLYIDFGQNVGAYQMLEQTARMLDSESQPLNVEQSQMLVELIKATVLPPAVLGGSDSGAGAVLAVDNPRFDESFVTLPRITAATLIGAEGVLTRSQLEVLQKVYRTQGDQQSTIANDRPARRALPSQEIATCAIGVDQ